MGLFSKKEPYQCKILEKYKIDIEKTNQAFQRGENKRQPWEGTERCDFVGESEFYHFYRYRTYPDFSGGYILRREKSKPKNVVYFGENKIFNCVFHDYLFQVSSGGELGRFGITGRNVNDGTLIKFNWLSEKAKFVLINGYGRFYSQDSVKKVYIQDGKLIFEVSREKSEDPREKNPKPDKYDLDIEYKLVVDYEAGKFVATRVFPVVPSDQASGSGQAGKNPLDLSSMSAGDQLTYCDTPTEDMWDEYMLSTGFGSKQILQMVNDRRIALGKRQFTKDDLPWAADFL